MGDLMEVEYEVEMMGVEGGGGGVNLDDVVVGY